MTAILKTGPQAVTYRSNTYDGCEIAIERTDDGAELRYLTGRTYAGIYLPVEEVQRMQHALTEIVNRHKVPTVSEERAAADVILAAADWLDCLRDEQWNGSVRRPNNYHRAAEDLRRPARQMAERGQQ